MGKMQFVVLSRASKEKQQIRGSQQRERPQDMEVWEFIQSCVMSLNCSFSGLDGIQDGYQPPKVQNCKPFGCALNYEGKREMGSCYITQVIHHVVPTYKVRQEMEF